VKDELNQTSTFDPGIPEKNERRLVLASKRTFESDDCPQQYLLDFPNEKGDVWLDLVIKAAPNIASFLFSYCRLSAFYSPGQTTSMVYTFPI
jgi:hypothetical protein